MTTTHNIIGTIQRVSITRISAAQSETGEEYWNVMAYRYAGGIARTLGVLVSFAPTREAAIAAAITVGAGPIPFLGSSEITLDGKVRGKEYAMETTGTDY